MASRKRPWEGVAGALLLALLCLFPASIALAQPRQEAAASQSCRRQCATQVTTNAPRDMQVCLVRCAAGERHMTQQRRAGTPEATGRGTLRSTTAGQSHAPMPRTRAIVAYVGSLPSTGLALSRMTDRQAAHRGAEVECYRNNNSRPCQLLAETQDRCMAVARGVRALGLVITNDPRTYSVQHYGVGAGATLQAAQHNALRDCQGRQVAGTHCRLASSRCG